MLKLINEIFSFFLELAMLAALSYSGFHYGDNRIIQYLLGIGIPLLIIIFWAKYMAPKAANRLSFPWLHLVTFLLFEASAAVLYLSGITLWAIILGVASLINIGLKFVNKDQRLPSPLTDS